MRFDIVRVELPQWVDTKEHELDIHRFGGQIEWSFAVPWTYEILASPRAQHSFIRAPQPGDGTSPVPTGYWLSALNLVIFGFGWSRPDLGLRWWYDNDQPVDDPKLALLKRIWAADGQLDFLVAWLWLSNQMANGLDLKHFGGWWSKKPFEGDPSWILGSGPIKDFSASKIPNPLVGVLIPCTFSGTSTLPLKIPRSEFPNGGSSRGEKPPFLVLDSMRGWYRALLEIGQQKTNSGALLLPEIDVVVTSVGHIGRYRYSPQTNLWYSGKLKLHLAGN